jgi:hypothetical protein
MTTFGHLAIGAKFRFPNTPGVYEKTRDDYTVDRFGDRIMNSAGEAGVNFARLDCPVEAI